MFYQVRTYYDYSEEFWMSVLRQNRVNPEIGEIPFDIYISDKLPGKERPLIKFDGGTEKTQGQKTMPSMFVTSTGSGAIELQMFMNKENCPNAYDKDKIAVLDRFLEKYHTILMLVWYKKLEKAEAIRFFKGAESLNQVIQNITDVDETVKDLLQNVTTLQEVADIMMKHRVYPKWTFRT